MEFKIAQHAIKNEQMVEVWNKDDFLAAIYQTPNGIKVISKYLDRLESVSILNSKPISVRIEFTNYNKR